MRVRAANYTLLPVPEDDAKRFTRDLTELAEKPWFGNIDIRSIVDPADRDHVATY